MCMYMCLYVHMCADVCGSQKKGLDPLDLEIQVVVSHPMWFREPNSSLKEQQVILTAEPYFYPPFPLFITQDLCVKVWAEHSWCS